MKLADPAPEGSFQAVAIAVDTAWACEQGGRLPASYLCDHIRHTL